MDNETQKQRAAIGQRLREAREGLPDERRGQKEFAEVVGISNDSHLSMMESGRRPVTAECLLRMAEVTGQSPNALLGFAVPRQDVDGFSKAIDFLQRASDMGVETLYPNRDQALYHMIPFIREMFSGEINIAGSSLKGLQQDANNEFVSRLTALQMARPRRVTVRIMFTHPAAGYSREVLEGRVTGSIVAEIWQGIRWAIEKVKVPPKNIRLVKASPNIFSIFAWNGAAGLGLVNPYPLMKQAFVSPSTILRSGTSNTARRPGYIAAGSTYESMLLANFRGPWEDTTKLITVSLEEGVEECSRADKEQLQREANAFREFLAEYTRSCDQPEEAKSEGGADWKLDTQPSVRGPRRGKKTPAT